MEWLYAVGAIASSLAAVLAWAAKLWWGKEFASAKDEIIRARESQIQVLERELKGIANSQEEIIRSKDAQIEVIEREVKTWKDLNSLKVREYYNSTKEQLEEYVDALKDDLAKAEQEVAHRDKTLAGLRESGGKQNEELEHLQSERDQLKAAAEELEKKLADLEKKDKSRSPQTYVIITPEAFENVDSSWDSLRQHLATRTKDEVDKHFFWNKNLWAKNLEKQLKKMVWLDEISRTAELGTTSGESKPEESVADSAARPENET